MLGKESVKRTITELMNIHHPDLVKREIDIDIYK
jgi:hypothetical protein